MFKAKTISLLLFAALLTFGGVRAGAQSVPPKSVAILLQDDYRKEFDDVCAKTQDAMILSLEELTALINRCDALIPRIEQLDETRKKVYMKRLVQCRGLYAYVLDSKRSEKK